MKIAIISDLHSNKEALDAVFAHVRAQGIQSMIRLGDVVGYGPDPQHCVDLVRGHAEVTVMQNHDEALFHSAADFNPREGRGSSGRGVRLRPRWWSGSETKGRWRCSGGLPHTHTIGRYTFAWIDADPVREYVPSTDGFPNPGKLRAIFDLFDGVTFGHTTTRGPTPEDLRFIGLEGATNSRSTCPRVRRGSSTSGPSVSPGTVTTAPATRS